MLNRTALTIFSGQDEAAELQRFLGIRSPRLEQLRTLLVGREIEVLSRLSARALGGRGRTRPPDSNRSGVERCAVRAGAGPCLGEGRAKFDPE